MNTRLKSLKALQLRSKLSFGIHKGLTVACVINQDPDYLIYARKRGWIKLSGSATTLLMWKITGHIKYKIDVDQHDTLSYYMFNDNDKESTDDISDESK